MEQTIDFQAISDIKNFLLERLKVEKPEAYQEYINEVENGQS